VTEKHIFARNSKKTIVMGRGDKRTRKGKTFKGSFGNSRPQKVKKTAVVADEAPVKKVAKAKVAKPETTEEKKVAKRAPAKKAAAKKTDAAE